MSPSRCRRVRRIFCLQNNAVILLYVISVTAERRLKNLNVLVSDSNVIEIYTCTYLWRCKKETPVATDDK